MISKDHFRVATAITCFTCTLFLSAIAGAQSLATSDKSRIDGLKRAPDLDGIKITISEDEQLCDTYKRYVTWEIAEKNKGEDSRYQRTTSLGNFGSLIWHDSPPQCKRPFSGEGWGFKSVPWVEANPEDHKELAVAAYRYIKNRFPQGLTGKQSKRTSEKENEISWGSIKANHANGSFTMWLAEADIDNSGQKVALLKVDDGRCGYDPRRALGSTRPPNWAVPVMVVAPSLRSLDEKTELLGGLAALPKTKSGYEGLHSFTLQSFDVFTYGGNTFFDRWEEEQLAENSQDSNHVALTVYKIHGEQRSLVCRFEIFGPSEN